MKEKIANALKTKYANLGLGNKAFDGVAAYLAQTVTKEEDIENAVAGEGVSSLLKAIQGESDGLRGSKVTAEKTLADLQKEFKAYKEAHPEKQNQQGDADSKFLERLTAIEAQLAEEKKKVHRTEVLAELKKKMEATGAKHSACLEDTLKELEVSETDTAETLVAKCEADYNAQYQRYFSEGAGVPRKAEHHDEGYKPDDYKRQIEMLRREKLLPAK